MLCIVNAERRVRGLHPLTRDARLELAAQRHSDDMATRNYFAHVTPEGDSPHARISRAGYDWSDIMETLAFGQSTPRDAMLGWMGSRTGHCTAVLAHSMVHVGIGVGRSPRGAYWTQNFGRPRGMAPPSDNRAPAAGCPYDRLSIQPPPARVEIVVLRRTGRSVRLIGVHYTEGAGRRVDVVVKRGRRSVRRSVVTDDRGLFTLRVQAPRGRGRVTVTITARAVQGVYETGSDTGRA